MTTSTAATLMVHGFIVAEQLLIVYFFARFWRQTRDRLFIFFVAGFAVMAIHRVALGLTVSQGVEIEDQAGIYLIRLASYLLIAAGIVVKNLEGRRRK